MGDQVPAKYRVMADYGSSGIWRDGDVGPFRHRMVKPSEIDIPTDLTDAFLRWIDEFWLVKDGQTRFDVVKFNIQGRSLAKSLKDALPAGTQIVYAPVVSADEFGPDENIV